MRATSESIDPELQMPKTEIEVGFSKAFPDGFKLTIRSNKIITTLEIPPEYWQTIIKQINIILGKK